MRERGLTFAAWPTAYHQLCDWSGLAPHSLRGFGRLLTWALPKGLDPLDSDTIRDFADHIQHNRSAGCAENIIGGLSLALMHAKPEERWDWMKVIQRQLGREARRAGPSKKPGGRTRVLTVPVDGWPAQFRTSWQAAISHETATEFAEFTDDEGSAARWSTHMKESCEKAYGQFLGWAARAGASTDVTPKSVRRFIRALQDRPCRPTTVAMYVERIHIVMRVTQPLASRDWLRKLVNLLKTTARHAPRRKDGRVVHAGELFDLGLRLMERASQLRPELTSTAVLFRDGLIFVVMAMAPVRAGSFLRARLGEHLDLDHGVGSLTWGAHETKEGRAEHYKLWESVRQLIDEYILVYRPVLAGTYDGTELWLAAYGRGPLKYAALRRAVAVRSKKHFGFPVSPHLVRDALALAISEDAPDEMELATILLHHASARSTIAYRNQASTISAARVAANMHERARDRAKREIRARSIEPSAREIDPVFARFHPA